MNLIKKLYSISQAAELIGVSADTLRRWEEEGLYQPVRTSGGQRRYDVSSLKKLRPLTRRFRGRKNLPSKDEVQFLIPAVSAESPSDVFHRPIYLNRKYLTFASVVMVWFLAFGFAFARTEVGKKFFGETVSLISSLFNSEEAMRRIAKEEIGWEENKKLGKVLGQENSQVDSDPLSVISYSSNLLKNFSFETKGTVESLAFWQLHPNSTNDNTQMSNATSHSGGYSLLLNCQGESIQDSRFMNHESENGDCVRGVIQESTKTEAKRNYTLGVWVKTGNSQANRLQANRLTGYKLHLALGPGYDKSFPITSDGNWHWYSTSFSNPPPGLVPRIYAEVQEGSQEIFLFLDDAVFSEAESFANASNEANVSNGSYGGYLASSFQTLLLSGGNVLSVSPQGVIYPTDGTQTQGGLGIESSRIGKVWGSNIDISQSLSVNEKIDISGKLTANGNVALGNNDGDELEIGARIISDLIPKTTNSISLGNTSLRWRQAYIDALTITNNATIGGSLTISGGLGISGGSGLSVTGDLSLDGDLDFTGPQNITTTSDNLTISPTGNLVIDTSGGTVIVRDASIDLTGQPTTISGSSLTLRSTGSFIIDTSVNNTDLRLQGGLGELRGDYGTIVLAAKNSLTLDTSQNNTNLLVQTGTADFNVNSGQLIVDGNGSLTLTPSNGQVTITGNTDVSNGLDVTNGFTVNGASSLGDGGITNYLSISNTGDLTMNGTANNIIANNDLVIRSAQSLTLDTSANNSNLLVRTGSGTFDVSVGNYTLTTSNYTQTTNGSINRTVAGNITDRITGANNYVLRVGDSASDSDANGNDIWLAAEDSLSLLATRYSLTASGGPVDLIARNGTMTLDTSTNNTDLRLQGGLGELRGDYGTVIMAAKNSLTLDTSANNTNLIFQGGTGGLTGNYGTMALTSTTDSSNSISISAARGGITLSTSNASGNGNLSLYSAGTLTLDTSSKNSNLRLQTGSGTLSASLGTATLSTENGAFTLLSRSAPLSLITESTTNGSLVLSSTGNLYLDTSRTGASVFLQGGLVRVGSGGTVSSVSGNGSLYIQGGLEVDGNVYLGDTISDDLTLTGQISSDMIPSVGSSYDIGSTTNRWSEGWFDTLTVTTLNSSANNITGITSNSFTIDTSNASDDTEDISITFERGLPGTNSQFLWDASEKFFSLNAAFNISPDTDITTLSGENAILNVNDSYGGRRIATFSEKGTPRAVIDSSGNILLYQSSNIETSSGTLTMRGYNGLTLTTSSATTGEIRVISRGTLQLDTSTNNDNILLRTGSGNVNVSSSQLYLTGNLVVTGTETFNGVAYTFPGADGSASNVLTTSGTGLLSWGTLGASSITADTLDFTEFKDSMNLDADTSINGPYSFIVRAGQGSIENSTSGSNDLQLSAADKLILAGASFDLSTSSGGVDIISAGRIDLSGHGTLTLDTSASNSNILLLPGTGNVGIGTTAPDAIVEFYRSQDTETKFQVTNPSTGTSAFSSIALHNDSGYGGLNFFGTQFATAGSAIQNGLRLWTGAPGGVSIAAGNSAGQIQFFPGNLSPATTVMDVNGNVGIGTYASAVYTLDVSGVNGTRLSGNGPIILRAGQSATEPSVSGTTSTTSDIQIAAADRLDLYATSYTLTTSGDSIDMLSGGRIDLSAKGTLTLDTSQNNTNILLLPGTGNVGIGTTSPGYKLDVNGTGRFVNDVTFDANLIKSAGNFLFKTAPSQGYRFADSSGNDFVRIDGSGNVGIGSTVPGGILDVIGNSSVLMRAGQAALQLSGGATSTTADIQLAAADRIDLFASAFSLQTSSTGGIKLISNDTLTLDTSQANQNIRMATGSGNMTVSTGTLTMTGVLDVRDSTGTLGLVVDSTGNVGVGTTSPGAKLEVNGSALLDSYSAIGTSLNSAVLLNIGGAITGTGYGIQTTLDIQNTASSAVYTAAGSTSGSGNRDHIAGFQSVNDHAGTGTMTNMYGFYAGDTVSNGAGTLTWYYGSKVNAPLGTGQIYGTFGHYVSAMNRGYNSNYGLYIEAPSGGSANNWGVYNLGTSYLAGNVGISSTSPAGILDIGTSSKGILLRAGEPGITISSSSAGNTADIQLAAPDRIDLFAGSLSLNTSSTTAGTMQLVSKGSLILDTSSSSGGTAPIILQGGNVGVGTTGPGALLHLVGSAATEITTIIDNTSTGDSAIRFRIGGLSKAIIGIDQSDGNSFKISPANFGTSDRLVIDSSGNFNVNAGQMYVQQSNGNVGIGTTGPLYTLDVSGGTRVIGDAGVILRAGRSSINLSSGTTSTTADLQLAAADRIDLFAGSLSLNTSSTTAGTMQLVSKGSLILDTSSSSGGTAPIILQGGNVGIGTTSPGAMLDIGSATNLGALRVAGATSDSINIVSTTSNIGEIYQGDWGAALEIYTKQAGTGTKNAGQLFLQSSGNVGIGNATPIATLDTIGNNGIILRAGQSALDLSSSATSTTADLQLAAADKVNIFASTFSLTTSSATAGDIKIDSAGTLTMSTSRNNTDIVLMPGTGTLTLSSKVSTGTGADTGALFWFDQLSTGTGFTLSSSSSAFSTGNLALMDWSPQNPTVATGDLLRLNIGANGDIGNLLNILDNGSSLFSVSESAITLGLPASFTSAGDVAIAYDLNFTNPTASYIKSAAPLYLVSGESFNSSDLTLQTYNYGDIILDAGQGVTLQTQRGMITLSTGAGNGNGNLILKSGGTLTLDTTSNDTGIDILAGDNTSTSLRLRSDRGGIDISTGAANGSGDLVLRAGGTLQLDTSATNSNILMRTGSGNINVSTGTLTMTGVLDVRDSTGTLGLVVDSTGNVGVGTTSPNAKLDVNGTSTFRGNVTFITDNNYIIGGDGDNRPYGLRVATDIYSPNIYGTLTAGGSITIQSTSDATKGNVLLNPSGGNVGIGSTVPAGILDIGTSAAGILLRAGQPGITISSSSAGHTADIQLAAPDRIDLFASSLSLQTSSTSAGNLKIISKGSLILDTSSSLGGSAPIILQGGNVGIGTTGPLGKLHVVGGINNSLVVDRTGAPTGKRIQLFVGDGTVQNGMTFVTDEPYYWGNNVNFHLGGNNGTTGLDQEYFTVIRTGTTPGNVGIGTTSPGAKLHISDQTGITGPNIKIDGALADGSDYMGGILYEIGGTDVASIQAKEHQANWYGLDFKTYSDGVFSPKVTILGNGNVGIGTTNPKTLLQLSGSTPRFGWVDTSSAADNQQWDFTPSGAVFYGQVYNDARTVSSNWLQVSRSGTTVGNISFPNGDVGIGTTEPINLQRNAVAQAKTATSNLGALFLTTNEALASNPFGAVFWVKGAAAAADRTVTIQTVEYGSSYSGNLALQSEGGNVGIGTTSPANKLEVAGVIKSTTGGISFPDGTTMTTAAATSTGDTSATDLNLAADNDSNGSGTMIFATHGSERMRIDNGGNVGIGTTSLSAKLQVDNSSASAVQGMMLSNSNAGFSADEGIYQSYYVGGNEMVRILGANKTAGGGSNGYLSIYTRNADALGERLRIDNAGNVGIGTTGPTNLLFVNQSANSTAATVGTYGLAVGTSGTASLTMGSDATYAYIQSWLSKPLYINSQGNNILFNGNVGIGTTSPSVKLQVNGSTAAGSIGTEEILALFRPTQGGVAYSQAAAFALGTYSLSGNGGFGPGSRLDIKLKSAGNDPYSANVTVMTLQDNGNVGISSTSPAGILDIGTSAAGILLRAGQPGITISSSATSTTADIQLAAPDRIDLFASSLSLQTSSTSAGNLKIISKGSLILDTSSSLGGSAPIILQGGNVGIGTTGPNKKLEVSVGDTDGFRLSYASAPSSYYLNLTAVDTYAASVDYKLQTVDATGGTKDMMYFDSSSGNVGIGTTNPDQAKLFVSGGLFLTLDTSGTTASGVCWDNSGGSLLYDCDSSPTDLAENFGTDDSTLEAGDVVVAVEDSRSGEVTHEGTKTSKAYISKSTSGYQSSLLGVVSTQPNQLYGDDGLFTTDENPKPVSLAGRVPVKIAPDSLPIKTGDSLTSSDTHPGMAMKATKAGEVIGKALERWEPKNQESGIMNQESTDKIVVFINVGYFMGSMTADGYIDTGLKMKVADVAIDTSLAEPSLTANGESLTVSSGENYTLTTSLSGLAQRVTQLEDLVSIMAGTNTLTTSTGFMIQDSGFIITGSYMDSEVNLGGNGLVSPLASTKLTLDVSTDTIQVLGSATVGGNLTIGLLTINDMDASINSMGETLKLQSLGMSNIEFMGGKVVMTKEGDMEITGDLKVVGEVTAEKVKAEEVETKRLCIEDVCVTRDELERLLKGN